VRLSKPSVREVRVGFSARPAPDAHEPATPGVGGDFYGVGGGPPLTFAPGETVATWQVVILDDDKVEPDEHIQVRIHAGEAEGATIDVPHAILTIADDD